MTSAPRAPAWNWAVAGYTWTKSIATGSFLAIIARRFLADSTAAIDAVTTLGLVAMIFLVLTGILLIVDLKQPKRFLYVLLRPQWRSWLVRGAYLITGFGAILSAWLVAHFAGAVNVADVLLWPGGVLAILSAVYTAFLFAQAKGRDFWQNPLLSVHLLAHSLMAGAAIWLVADFVPADALVKPRLFLAGTLIFSLVSLLAEIATTPATIDARLALDWIIGRPMGRWFWIGGIAMGHVLPLLLLAMPGNYPVLAAPLALAGLYIIERLWVLAPQQVPLS